MKSFIPCSMQESGEGETNMSDQLTEAYADLIEGSYDCPDRIVLNAYFGMGHSPGGFRSWWRRLYGTDDDLDKTHLIRLAGRFSRRMKAYAVKHDIPVLYCKPGERKHLIAQKHIPKNANFCGLFLVLISRASGLVWDVSHTQDGRIRNLARNYRFINHYFFHIMDPVWGHVTIRMSGHPPFSANIILNGHEYVSRLAASQGIELPKEGNCFTAIIGHINNDQTAVTSCSQNTIGPMESVDGSPNLTQLAETLCSSDAVGQLRQVCDRWIYSACLHFVLPETERLKSGFCYGYSIYQTEYSRNLLFLRGAQMEQVFDTIIDLTRSRLDIKRIKTIFGFKKRPSRKRNNTRRPREEVVIEQPSYDLTIFKIHMGPLTVKLYAKGERVLRCEAVVHNAKALGYKRALSAFPQLVQRLKDILERFLNQLHCLSHAFIADNTLDTLAEHGQVGKSRTTGIDLDKPRLRAVISAVIALAPSPRGFTVSQLAREVRALLGLDEDQYLPRHASYDLKKLRGKHWVHKIDKSRRYEPDLRGLKIMTALLTLREKVIKPVLAGVAKPKRGSKPIWQSDLDFQYGKVQTEMRNLFHILGVVV
ncbi:MAG: hypothetical protein MUO62_10585 [Anaerolineales bacterium]|nr:hypothetical protein [Anaerolineales bacterium]